MGKEGNRGDRRLGGAHTSRCLVHQGVNHKRKVNLSLWVWDSQGQGKVLQQLFRQLPGEEWVMTGYMRCTATGPRPGNTSGVSHTKADKMISYRSYAMMRAPWAWQRELFQLWTRQKPPLLIYTENTHPMWTSLYCEKHNTYCLRLFYMSACQVLRECLCLAHESPLVICNHFYDKTQFEVNSLC